MLVCSLNAHAMCDWFHVPIYKIPEIGKFIVRKFCQLLAKKFCMCLIFLS